MTTALDLIAGAAKLIGVTFKSESLSADEAVDGLTSLNDMLASWTNNGLLVTSRVRESFSIAAGTSYLIGAGQTLNTVRPLAILEAFIRSGDIDYPMDQITDEQYCRTQDKTTGSPFPDYYNYDGAYPYGTITLFPALSASAALHILSEKPLANIAGLSTEVNLLPGGNRAVRYNLAVEMAPEYGQSVPGEVAKIAADSLASIELATAKNRPIKYRPRQVSVGNIYSGYY